MERYILAPGQPLIRLRARVCGEVVKDHMSFLGGMPRRYLVHEFKELTRAAPEKHLPVTSPVPVSSAANRLVFLPWRL